MSASPGTAARVMIVVIVERSDWKPMRSRISQIISCALPALPMTPGRYWSIIMDGAKQEPKPQNRASTMMSLRGVARMPDGTREEVLGIGEPASFQPR